jgi:DNA repair exonuclease SbcCD ATPase subunit
MVKKGSFFRRLFGITPSEKSTADVIKNMRSGRASVTKKTATATKDAPAGARSADAKGSEAAAGAGKPGLQDRKAGRQAGEDFPGVSVKPEILGKDEGVAELSGTEFEVITEKLSQQEEMSVKISQGLKGLSSLLGDIDERLQEQTKQSTELVQTVRTIPDKLKDLPESSRAGLELLNTISKIMEQQSRSVESLNSKVTGFSSVLNDIGEKMENDARDRTETAEAFQHSIGSVKETISGLSEQQSRLSAEQATNIKAVTQAMKRSSEEQHDRMENIVSRMKVMNGLVIFLILVIIAGLVAVVLSLT